MPEIHPRELKYWQATRSTESVHKSIPGALQLWSSCSSSYSASPIYQASHRNVLPDREVRGTLTVASHTILFWIIYPRADDLNQTELNFWSFQNWTLVQQWIYSFINSVLLSSATVFLSVVTETQPIDGISQTDITAPGRDSLNVSAATIPMKVKRYFSFWFDSLCLWFSSWYVPYIEYV